MAAKVLAKALGLEGKVVKAIPAFGFERRGAPVESYMRFDDHPIRKITNIYHPNAIVCLDPTLPRAVDIFNGMSENGVYVQATKKSINQLTLPKTVKTVGLCDAVGLAMEVLGKPITNTIMLGVFAKTTGIVSLDSVNKAMESVAFRDALLDRNIAAVQRGYDETTVHTIN